MEPSELRASDLLASAWLHFGTHNLDGAIALAQQIAPRWIILDDLAARRVAEGLGLPVIGTLGVLLLAKDAGFLSPIKPVLDQLREHSLYISEALYAAIVTSAGESV